MNAAAAAAARLYIGIRARIYRYIPYRRASMYSPATPQPSPSLALLLSLPPFCLLRDERQPPPATLSLSPFPRASSYRSVGGTYIQGLSRVLRPPAALRRWARAHAYDVVVTITCMYGCMCMCICRYAECADSSSGAIYRYVYVCARRWVTVRARGRLTNAFNHRLFRSRAREIHFIARLSKAHPPPPSFPRIRMGEKCLFCIRLFLFCLPIVQEVFLEEFSFERQNYE